MTSCKKTKNIPTAKIQEGISRCKDNCADYIKDAKLIASTGRFYHAAISLEYALEEFGKASLLKKARDVSTNGLVTIDSTWFYKHDRKLEEALSIIDRQGKYRYCFEEVITTEPNFEAFGTTKIGISFQIKGTALMSDKTRQNYAFVNYIDDRWTLSKDIKPVYFEDLITLLEKELEKL